MKTDMYDENVQKLIAGIKDIDYLCGFALGNGLGDNPIYKKIQELNKVVDVMRVERLKAENEELQKSLWTVGFFIAKDDNATINFIRQKLLFEQLKNIYNTITEVSKDVAVYLELDADNYVLVITVTIQGEDFKFSPKQFIELQFLIKDTNLVLKLS